MNRDGLLNIIQDTFVKIEKLEATKGKEYTDGSSDRLENFKSEGKNIGISELAIWSVYASKHFRSIQSYIRNDGKIFSNEPIEGRIDDLILYLLLLKGLVKDRNMNTVGKMFNVEVPFTPFQQMEEPPVRDKD